MRTKLIHCVVWSCLISTSAGLKAQNIVDPDDPASWMVNSASLANSMNIYAVIDVAGVESIDENDVIGVFMAGTNEILGIASPEYVVSQDRYIANLFVYSDEGMGDPDGLSILVYDASIDRVLPSTTSYTFSANGIIGSFSEPDTIETVKITIAISKDDVLCEADTFGWASANVSGTGKPPFTLNWSTGSDQDSIFHLGAGRYYLTVTDDNSFSVFDSIDIVNTNRPILVPTVEINGNLPVCSGELFFLIGSSQHPGASFNWYDSGNALLAEGRDIYVSPGITESTTWFAETNENGCTSTRVPVEITIQKPNADFRISPQSNIREGEVVQLRPTDERYPYTYLWHFGDGGWSTFIMPYYFYNKAGTYDVSLEVTDRAGCKNTVVKESFVNVIRLGTGEPIAGIPDEVVVFGTSPTGLSAAAYPNPFRDHIWIRFENVKPQTVELNMVDAMGRVVLHQRVNLEAGVTTHRLRVANGQMPPGPYFLQWRTDTLSKSISLIRVEP